MPIESRSEGHDAAARPGGAARLASWIALAAAVAAVSLCHYLTPPSHVHWHLVYQRLYYLPILIAAFRFGLVGGVSIALLTTALYLPHIVLHWGHEPLYRSNQLAEIFLFLVIGAVAGALVDRWRREQEKQRRTAEELARAYAQLQQTFERLRLVDRLSALGALSAGLAHEIKNPLGSILGSIEILESAAPSPVERREFVGILKREIERLSSIVGGHLDLLRSGRLQRSPQDLGELVSSVVELTRKQATQQGVTLRLSIDPGLPRTEVDGQMIRQAVLNLLLNALQALPGGGAVEVSVGRTGDRLSVVVEDDGPGLGEEERRRAFEPFFTTKERGTGLGLSIAFQIADQHGGDLRAENRPSGGARFLLELPLVAEASEQRRSRVGDPGARR